MPELDDEFDAGDYSRDQERYHVEDPDTEDEVLEETPEIADAHLDGNRLDLCSDLADWTVTHNQTHKSLNDLLKILREHGHSELPKDSRTLLCTPKVVECQAKCNGEYIYYGLETGIRRTLLQCPASTDHIAVTINVDGVPLFRSSAAQFWPMLAKVEGFEPFIVCLFSGTTKPVPLGDYIQDLAEEIKRLGETGIQHNGNVIQDIPAQEGSAPARPVTNQAIEVTEGTSPQLLDMDITVQEGRAPALVVTNQATVLTEDPRPLLLDMDIPAQEGSAPALPVTNQAIEVTEDTTPVLLDMTTQLRKIGGKNTRDCTTKIMDRIMTNNLMSQLNMKGNGTK
ncbi:hypothetical protein E1301_Tti013665 [Triplophysa tibetana]|uniref:Uncharacterized protein n=1 Tax=Triplophysa tibetana TaxID=1572043 RepID=A0A5A9PM60_9TELE|nr:hypothetical protein E1301_Tti013665 [Triplophysa tibetana]